MTPIIRALTALAAPAGPRCRLSVFYFHRVLETPDPLLPYEPDARIFDHILGWIGSQFRVLDPVEACDRLFDGSLPSRPAVITFDDGYRDNYTVALPILQRHRMKAAFFVATGFLEGGMMFNDRVIEAVRRTEQTAVRLDSLGSSEINLADLKARRVAIDHILNSIKHLEPSTREEQLTELEIRLASKPSGNLMMVPEHLSDMARAGMVIGGHTRTHPILLSLNVDEAQAEIIGCRTDLAQILETAPLMFAYPNGKLGSDFTERDMRIVRDSGFLYAFSTEPGPATNADSRLVLPRYTPWDRDRLRFQARALKTIVR